MESKAEYARRMRLRQKLELQQIEGEIAPTLPPTPTPKPGPLP